MVVEATKYVLLDPTVPALPDNTALAPRVPDLNGKVLGLLANGKRNSEQLLEAVCALIQDSYELRDVVRANKRDASRPAPQKIVDELVEKCDVVITATGD